MRGYQPKNIAAVLRKLLLPYSLGLRELRFILRLEYRYGLQHAVRENHIGSIPELLRDTPTPPPKAIENPRCLSAARMLKLVMVFPESPDSPAITSLDRLVAMASRTLSLLYSLAGPPSCGS